MIADSELEWYTDGPVSLWIRNGHDRHSETDVVYEVQRTYFQDVLDYSKFQTAIDIGAHIGSFSVWLKSVNPNIYISMVEQDEDNAYLAGKNMSRFFSYMLLHGRCGYQHGDLVVARHVNNEGGHMILPREQSVGLIMEDGSIPDVHEWSGVTMTLDTLVEFILQFVPSVDLLKLDCEGSEIDILQGCEEATLDKIGVIVGEFHTGQEDFLAKVGDKLRRHYDEIAFRKHVFDAPVRIGSFMARKTAL